MDRDQLASSPIQPKSKESASINPAFPAQECANQSSNSRNVPNTMKCKDIPDAPILDFLDALNGRLATWFDYDPQPDNTVVRAMPPGTPEKLVCAKMRMMIRRGIVDGCPCGCRGDYTITEKGKMLLLAFRPNADVEARREPMNRI